MSEEAVALGDGEDHSAGSVEADQETAAPAPEVTGVPGDPGDESVESAADEPGQSDEPEQPEGPQGDDPVASREDELPEPAAPTAVLVDAPEVPVVAAPAESAADELTGSLADASEQVPAADDDPAASVPIVQLSSPEQEPQAADLAGAEAPGAEASTAENPTSSARTLLLSVLGVIVLLVVGVIGGMWYFGGDEPTDAAAGDCLTSDGVDHVNGSVTIVRCDDSTAKYKVIGRVENRPESEANSESTLCQRYSGTEFIYWEGVRGKKGTVLCLATND